MAWLLRTLFVLGLLAPAALGATSYRYPLADPQAEKLARSASGGFFIIHVDHDPTPSVLANMQCLAFDGAKNFPNCYDRHTGTDYLLDGAFEAMDAGSLEVVAAADGLVVEAVDGNYDRCHADAASQAVSCDGHPIKPNYVALEHADGRVTLYYHLKQGSVLVSAGELVACGQVLALVGSSGISSTPHLHFQVEDATGAWVDPYAGSASQPDSLWVVQDGPYGIPAAWCEGDEPAWPEVGPEVVEPVEAEAQVEAVEEPAEVVEAPPEAVGEVGEPVPEGVETAAEAVETSREAVEPGSDVTESPIAVDDAKEPSNRRAIGCQASGAGTSPVLAFGVLAALALAFARRRTRARDHAGAMNRAPTAVTDNDISGST